MIHQRASLHVLILSCACSIRLSSCFTTPPPFHPRSTPSLQHRASPKRVPRFAVGDVTSSDAATPPPATDLMLQAKDNLLRCVEGTPTANDVLQLVCEVEDTGEQVGVGQGSAYSGLLSGEWELLFASEDETRSSPFFWAFRKAFPEVSDDIFSITDAIPAPLKETGPAVQTINMDDKTFISRVKVATLGGFATSIMTTRATVMGTAGTDLLRLRVDTTKPEDSTILEKLGPLGELIAERTPPFPSGEVLEKARAGSSEVFLKNTFCDETLRITRNGESLDDFYVWRRKGFVGDFAV